MKELWIFNNLQYCFFFVFLTDKHHNNIQIAMDELSMLVLSPGKTRLNYTITSKSTKSTGSKKDIASSIEIPSENQLRRSSFSPKKSTTQSIKLEMMKLEEELDTDEISLQLYEIQKLNNEQRKEAEKNIYEKYIENLIQCINKTDNRIGRSLLRGWKGYQKSLEKCGRIRKNIDLNKKSEIQTKEIGIQCNENFFESPSETDFDLYINSLHKVISGMNHLHVEKIINKLDDLKNNLKPIDIPSSNSSLDLETLDFTDTLKSIHNRLKANMRPKKKEPEIKTIPKAFSTKTCQTLLKYDDLKTLENLKIIIIDKDSIIIDLKGKVRTRDDNIELVNRKIKECDELKKTIYDLQTTACPQCQAKKQKIEEDSVEIKTLQLSVYKSITIERELEITKNKLKDTMTHLSIQNSKILKLEDNVDDLAKRVEETKAQREALMEKLNIEHGLREKVEVLLSKEIQQNANLKKIINKTISPEKQLFFNENFETEISSQTRTPNHRSIKKHTKRSQIVHNLLENTSSYTPESHDNYNNISPDTKKKIFIRENIRRGVSSDRVSSVQRLAKINKESTIMDILKITKEEYLQLSKKARMELFECLYEHKEKCGVDCEHLKRAMMIRMRDKGQLFPMKKYNIS